MVVPNIKGPSGLAPSAGNRVGLGPRAGDGTFEPLLVGMIEEVEFASLATPPDWGDAEDIEMDGAI